MGLGESFKILVFNLEYRFKGLVFGGSLGKNREFWSWFIWVCFSCEVLGMSVFLYVSGFICKMEIVICVKLLLDFY